MGMESAQDLPRGVYLETAGRLHCLHRFELGDYGLDEIPELLLLGEACDHGDRDWICLRLEEHELHELRVQADAYSFDFEQGFIEMCLDIVRGCAGRKGPATLWANF